MEEVQSHTQNSHFYTSGSKASGLDMKNSLLQTHFTKLMDQNEAYLNHLKGDCICGRCICGQCKCPKMFVQLDFKKGQESLYQREYQQRQRTKDIPLMDHTAIYKSKLPMDLQTIQRSTYFPHPDSKPAESLKPEQRVFVIPFSSGSTYQLNYGDTGGVKSLVIKPPFHPTVVDMPFKEKSSYQDNFYKKPIPKEEFQISANKSTFKNPINPELPFIHQTSNSTFYKPYKTAGLPPKEVVKSVQSIPSFAGQFSSTTTNDFYNKNPKKCPSRQYLSSLYKSKLEAIK